VTLNIDRYSHLTFDCYGTLIDWERGILAALRPLLERHGVAPADEQVLELFGELEAAAEAGPYQPYRAVLAAVVDGLGARLGFAPTAAERAALAASVGDWPPFPDTVEALQSLARRFRLAILSNVDDDLFALTARHLPVDFAAVITAQQVGSYKPDRRNFQFALARLGVPADRVLHVAQSLFHDIVPAKELGLAAVWINRRHDRPGFGATPRAAAWPDLEVPDLRTLARLASEAPPARG
jgi:2-haloacid dehalogenase